jgi:hypothetical protein
LHHYATALDDLYDFIIEHGIEVVIIDPTYLCLPLAEGASNLFIVGAVLKKLTELGLDTGATILLCHHARKNRADEFAPTQLEDIAWAGFQEWARQWVLLNRRCRYNPEEADHHELSLVVGGSAGHSGAWGINCEEGSPRNEGGRIWEADVVTMSEAIELDATEKAAKKQRQTQRKREASAEMNRTRVLKALKMYPNGETPKQIREMSGLNNETFGPILAQLAAEMTVTKTQVRKSNGQSYDGFMLHRDTGIIGKSQ